MRLQRQGAVIALQSGDRRETSNQLKAFPEVDMQFGFRCKFEPVGNTLNARIMSGPVTDQVIATELYGDPNLPVKHSKSDFMLVEVDPANLLAVWRPYFHVLAGTTHNDEMPDGEVIEISGLDVEQLADEATTLRAVYNKGNEELVAKGRAMLAKGDSEEKVARWIVNERNELKVTIRKQGNALFRKIAEWRNQSKYQNAKGPAFEQRVASLSGKVPPEKINITIIEGTTKTSAAFNAAGEVLGGVAKAAEVAGFIVMATQDSPAADTPLPKSATEEVEIERARLRLGIPAGANIDKHGHLKPAFYMQIDILDPHGGDEFDAETDEILWFLGVSLTYRYGGVEWTVPGR